MLFLGLFFCCIGIAIVLFKTVATLLVIRVVIYAADKATATAILSFYDDMMDTVCGPLMAASNQLMIPSNMIHSYC